MKRITALQLRKENDAFLGSGGTSAGCASREFRPAFLDYSTMTVYPSRFADGRAAPLHLLDGLPAEVVAKGTLVSGFERGGFFYTRTAAAKACEEWRV